MTELARTPVLPNITPKATFNRIRQFAEGKETPFVGD